MNCFFKIAALCTLLGAVQAFAGEEEIVRPFIEAREKVRAQQNMLKKEETRAPGSGDVQEAGKRIASPNAVYPLIFSEKKRMNGSLDDWSDIPFSGELMFQGDPSVADPAWGASFKAAVSEDTLYLLLTARDPKLHFGIKPAYNSDCFELFFDPFFHCGRMDDGTAQIFITATGEEGARPEASGKYPVKVIPVPFEGGWAAEAAIPLDNDYFKMSPYDGLAFGFNVSYNSNDEGKVRTRKLTWSGIDRNDESWMDASLYGAMRVVRAGSSAIRPVRPGSAIEENRKRRRAGETLADPSVIRTVKPNPAVVRGFMSGGLRGGQSFRDMANDWNANAVRLQLWSVGPKPTWTEENYPVFLDRLETAVRQARDAGLKVIPVAFEVPCELNGKEMWEVPGVEEAFIRYWTGIVERLAPYRDALWGYDLFNEPLARAQLPYAPVEWRQMAVNITKAIRRLDPDTWIIYEVGPGGGWRGFEDLVPLPDPKVIYSFHFYEPGAFTHQGIAATLLQDPGLLAKAQETTGVVYPGFIGGRYRDRKEMEESLQPVIDFQKKYGAPIFVGEFSVIAWAPVASAVQYLKDLTGIFQKYGWSWTYHAFREYQGWSLEHEDGVLVKDANLKMVGMSKRGEVILEALKANSKELEEEEEEEEEEPAAEVDFSRENMKTWSSTRGAAFKAENDAVVIDGTDWDSKINRNIRLKSSQRYRIEGVGRGKTMVRLQIGWGKAFCELNLSGNEFRRGITEFTTPAGDGRYNLAIQVNAPEGRAEVKTIRFIPVSEEKTILDPVKLRASRPNPEIVRGFMVAPEFSKETARDLRSWGADVIRLQIFPLSFARQRNQEWREAMPAFLDDVEEKVKIARDHRLKVVIDLHHPPMPGVRADDTEMWEHPDLEKNFTAFWRAVATRLKPYGDVIWGYDLLNEPLDRNQLPHAPREWRPLAVKILKAIREIDPDVWIIYEPGPGGGTAGLRNLRPLPDYKVIYSTHFYDPGAFTHQGIHNIAGTDRLKVEEKINVRYPGVIDGVYYDKGKLAESLKIIDDFQARYPVPWFIGEFSVVRWAPAGSGEQFLRDALELFEERKWSWTYHAFREHHCWSLEHDGQFWREGMPSPKPVGDTPRGQVVRNFLTK